MAKIDDVTRGEFDALLRDVRQMRYATPLNGASIGSGGLRVYGGGVITIENGGLKVTGTAEIIGTLIASGIIDFTGDVTISGPLTVSGATDITGPLTIAGTTDITGNTTVTGDMTVTGPTHLNGDTDINGLLDITGNTTLTGDMDVIGGGKIKAGNVHITPNAADGGIEFLSGGAVGANGGAVVVKGSGNTGFISNPTTSSIFAGANSVDVKGDATTVRGPLKVTGITSTANAANVYFDPVSKQLYYKP